MGEMSGYIYESPDVFEEDKPRMDTDGDMYANVAVNRRHTVQDPPSVQKAGPFKLAVGCLVLLCVVLLTVIIGLCVKFDTERDELQIQLCNLENVFKRYAVNVTLDRDTAYPQLILSADGKQVRYKNKRRNITDNPNRFGTFYSVLATHGFSSGRFYYEVQVSGKTEWSLGVARESINRKERVTLSPQKGYWTICQTYNDYKARDDAYVVLSLKEKPERVGVFVDYEAGLVSFYDVDRWNHIYSFRGPSFNEIIYPLLNPGGSNEGDNVSPLIIMTPVLCAK
ncbi:E3 ubiquitin-protein ligase TRIM39-like [Clupea harengus]|uniref:E3 ubiquitin-protein ligase TRIM39-like n=1 Tax=Clupea harengus TaxID=7950 RepID=A0A6P8GSZ7_CLUHA|nr:E3 ubiquitin-protein ligase TRIM39-like [Clupea harengus]